MSCAVVPHINWWYSRHARTKGQAETRLRTKFLTAVNINTAHTCPFLIPLHLFRKSFVSIANQVAAEDGNLKHCTLIFRVSDQRRLLNFSQWEGTLDFLLVYLRNVIS